MEETEKKIKLIKKNLMNIKKNHKTDMEEMREAIYSLTDKIGEIKMPLVNLKNGDDNLVPMSEGVEDTWYKVNKVQAKVDEINILVISLNQRTQVLDDISVAIKSWKIIKKRIGKYINYKLFLKIIIILSIIGLAYRLIKGDVSVVDFIIKILKSIF